MNVLNVATAHLLSAARAQPTGPAARHHSHVHFLMRTPDTKFLLFPVFLAGVGSGLAKPSRSDPRRYPLRICSLMMSACPQC